MFLKKIQKFIAIILTFLSFSFNLNAQISDNFLLLYESYEKLNNIEQVIQGSEKRIYRKYGVSETLILDKNLKIQPTEHFIGYQIKKFNDLRLIELKFNKDSIEDFFVKNSVPFFSFKGKTRVYIAANDSFFNDSNFFIVDNKDFQNELANAKLLSELNQNIELEFQFLEEFPETGYKVEELLLQIQQAEKNNWLLMLVDRFDLKNWSYSFPKTSSVIINNNFNFSATLLNEAINEVVEVDSEIIKRTFTASFEPNLDIEEIELIFNKLSESTDILNFWIVKANEEAIELEYESYLDLEDAAEFLVSLGAEKNI
ncbi:MAG: hypothetical protein CMQ70_02575 [Gammaproteobacteria bacterium]|nr:hypothetical protein [Gammaproteobacteria bacterium]|tara:strand:- start:4526 stop:5467 length:942 start_codon:yes stop_codon:yes gene_type:complete